VNKLTIQTVDETLSRPHYWNKFLPIFEVLDAGRFSNRAMKPTWLDESIYPVPYIVCPIAAAGKPQQPAEGLGSIRQRGGADKTDSAKKIAQWRSNKKNRNSKYI
jgi:hypothetical protein